MLLRFLFIAILLFAFTKSTEDADQEHKDVEDNSPEFSLLLRELDMLTRKKAPSRREFERIVLMEHNKARQKLVKKARSMPMLKWDRRLARTARKYARKCRNEHNRNRGNTGENIYATSGSKLRPDKPVKAWVNETKHMEGYRSLKGRCNRECGHYTQVIWAKTTEVGCGFARCRKLKIGKKMREGYIVVCNYKPPGNYRNTYPYERKRRG